MGARKHSCLMYETDVFVNKIYMFLAAYAIANMFEMIYQIKPRTNSPTRACTYLYTYIHYTIFQSSNHITCAHGHASYAKHTTACVCVRLLVPIGEYAQRRHSVQNRYTVSHRAIG